MSYSRAICNAITSFLTEDDWHYTLDNNREVITCGVNLNNKLRETKLIIDLRDDKYIVYATMSLKAEPKQYTEMARLLNMINWSMVFGNFEMDESDGEIRFRLPVNCNHCIPSREVVRHSIMVPPMMMEKYGNAMIAVLMDVMDATSAFKKYSED